MEASISLTMKSQLKDASERTGAAFDRMREARSASERLRREIEENTRQEVLSNLVIVVEARRSHLKLAELFPAAPRDSRMGLTQAVEIEDGMSTEFRDVSVYVRTVHEALVARDASQRR